MDTLGLEPNTSRMLSKRDNQLHHVPFVYSQFRDEMFAPSLLASQERKPLHPCSNLTLTLTIQSTILILVSSSKILDRKMGIKTHSHPRHHPQKFPSTTSCVSLLCQTGTCSWCHNVSSLIHSPRWYLAHRSTSPFARVTEPSHSLDETSSMWDFSWFLMRMLPPIFLNHSITMNQAQMEKNSTDTRRHYSFLGRLPISYPTFTRVASRLGNVALISSSISTQSKTLRGSEVSISSKSAIPFSAASTVSTDSSQ